MQEGLRLWHEGEIRQAEQALLRATAADPSSASSYNNLAIVLGQNRRFRESIAVFRTAIRLSPDAIEPHVNLGNLYCSIGWFDEAIEQYEVALAIGGENLDVLGRLAYVHSIRGDDAKTARPYLERLAGASRYPQWQSWATEELERSRE
jgi:Flp pilus assembly protein TadD